MKSESHLFLGCLLNFVVPVTSVRRAPQGFYVLVHPELPRGVSLEELIAYKDARPGTGPWKLRKQ
jgi:hypothetical protein